MRIINLELENYRKYAQETIDFPDGLVGILGPNGAGKTTILEAVGWALYGNAAARTTKEQIKRQGASLSDQCQVILEIEQNGDTSQIVRQMKGANFSSDAAVYTNKKLMARGTHAATQYITRLFGLDREAFFTTFFAKQKELNALSDLRPAERKNLIIKMLKIDDIDHAIQQIRQDMRDIDVRTDILRSTLKDVASLETALLAIESEAKKIKDELEKMTKKETVLLQNKNDAKAFFQKEEERKETYQKLVQHYTLTKSQLSNCQRLLENAQTEHGNLSKAKLTAAELAKEIQQFEEVKQECQKMTDLRSKRLLWSEKMEQQQKLAARLNKEDESKQALMKQAALIPRTDKRLKEARGRIEKANNALEEALALAHKNQAELANLKEQEQNLQAQSKEIKKLGPESTCPTCFRRLGDDCSKIEAHLAQELARCTDKIAQKSLTLQKEEQDTRTLKEAIEKLDEQREKLNEEKNGLHIAQNELTLRRQSIKQITDELINLKRQLKEVEVKEYEKDKHAQLQKKLEQLSHKRDEFLKIQASLERLPEIEKNISSTKEEIRKLTANLAHTEKLGAELSFSQEKFERSRKDFEDVDQKYNDFRLLIKDLQHNFNLSSLEAEKLKTEIKEDKEKQVEIRGLTTKRQYLDKTQIILGDFRKHLIGRIRPLLSQKASEFLTQVTDGKYSAIELNEDYDMFIYDEGEKFLIDRFSGGEKDLANLCLRLAVSQLITESAGSTSEFMILDEVFGSQDTERKNNILKALSKLNNQFRQIFLITHIDDIKDQVEYVLSIKEDEIGVSHATLE